MKYGVGDKIRYDGGDWWFYGTVSAAFEHPICPCYRLSIERMEKKNCNFSITQFEFELEATEVDDKKPEPEKRVKPQPELKQRPEKVELTQIQTKEPSKRKTSEVWERNLEQYLNGEKSYAIYNWITNNRKQHQTGTLSKDKYEKLKGINFPFKVVRKKVEKKQMAETPKRKRGDDWEINFELYQKGEKSDTISSWIANNRKEFKTGKLTEAKYEKLVGVNFPFDVGHKKDDDWEKIFEEWKNGDRKSIKVQQWKQRSIRQYSEDKLSVDRILKLKEVGILK